MKETVIECLRDRCNFRKVEDVPSDDHDWAINVHAGTKEDEYGNSYVIVIYKHKNADHIIVKSSASIEEHTQMIEEIPDEDVIEMQLYLTQITIANGMLGKPEDRNGSKSPLMYADTYSFYQYFFPEQFSSTQLVRMVNRSLCAVDFTWSLFWYYGEQQ